MNLAPWEIDMSKQPQLITPELASGSTSFGFMLGFPTAKPVS